MIWKLMTVIPLLAVSIPTHARDKKNHLTKSTQTSPVKNRVWAFEMGLMRYAQRGYVGHSIDGVGGKFSLGYGVVKPSYFLLGNVDVYLGPFGISFRTVKLDYLATGLSVIGGSSLDTLSLRGKDVAYGVLSGLGYQQYSGTSYARTDVDDPVPPTSAGIVTSYASQFVSVDVSFGLFASIIKAARADEHDPDSLVTRNEGVILSVQGIVPLFSRFRSSFKVLDAENETQTAHENSSISGFRLLVSLRVFLGT